MYIINLKNHTHDCYVYITVMSITMMSITIMSMHVTSTCMLLKFILKAIFELKPVSFIWLILEGKCSLNVAIIRTIAPILLTEFVLYFSDWSSGFNKIFKELSLFCSTLLGSTFASLKPDVVAAQDSIPSLCLP